MPGPFLGDTLVLASHNRGKLHELTRLLEPYQLRLLPVDSLTDEPAPEETGRSCQENAALKARAAAAATGLPALADDCGFFVEALGGQPGIHLSRCAAAAGGWAQGMRRLLDELEQVGARHPWQRRAHFGCALSLAWPQERRPALTVYGQRRGTLPLEPRGDQGSGFDPIFIPWGHHQTYAQMSLEQRERCNHRAVAFMELVQATLTQRGPSFTADLAV